MTKAATATRKALYESALSLFSEANLAADTFAANRRIRAVDRSRIRLGGLFRKQGALLLTKLEVIQPYFTRRDALLEHAGPECFWESVDDELSGAFVDIFGGTQAQAEDALAMTLTQGLAAGFTDAASGFGIEGSFSLSNHRATDWASGNAADRVAGINSTTELQIRNIVTTGLQNGTSYGEVANQISKRFSDFAGDDPHSYIRSRAELVAVTENAFAYESGSRNLVDEITAVGITMEKSYGGPRDGITSDGCLENLDAGWIPLDQPFPTGIQHPPNHPGCRHDTMYRVAEPPPEMGFAVGLPVTAKNSEFPSLTSKIVDKVKDKVKDKLKGLFGG